MSQTEISANMAKLRARTKENGGNRRKDGAGPFRRYCTGEKLAANGRKFNLLHKKKEKIGKKFNIALAEKANLQEAAEKSRNNWQNEQTPK